MDTPRITIGIVDHCWTPLHGLSVARVRSIV
jgi:hypothetical protein